MQNERTSRRQGPKIASRLSLAHALEPRTTCNEQPTNIPIKHHHSKVPSPSKLRADCGGGLFVITTARLRMAVVHHEAKLSVLHLQARCDQIIAATATATTKQTHYVYVLEIKMWCEDCFAPARAVAGARARARERGICLSTLAVSSVMCSEYSRGGGRFG